MNIHDATEIAYRNGYAEGRRACEAEIVQLSEKCQRLEKERDEAWNTASLLCEGFLDMPSGCDGCPLLDTMILDEEGNGICSLSRRNIDE